jgi:hypothetical protein
MSKKKRLGFCGGLKIGVPHGCSAEFKTLKEADDHTAATKHIIFIPAEWIRRAS